MTTAPGSRALRFAVIGSPVAHSRSPEMHAAAYRALGLPHAYSKIETSEAELPERVEALRRGDFEGLNVTVPHKSRVLSLVDHVDASAAIAGAANTLVRSAEGRVTAHNTDAPALAAELLRLAGERGRDAFRGKTGIVVGTGGAARAAIVALASLGCRRAVVAGRRIGEGDREGDASFAAEAERMFVASAPSREAIGTTSLVTVPLARGVPVTANVAAIVQATSCGMKGGPPGDLVASAIRWEAVPEEAIAYDVVYTPRDTPFLSAARARGLAADDGLGMLARQGALAFELWLGVPAPLDAMIAALA